MGFEILLPNASFWQNAVDGVRLAKVRRDFVAASSGKVAWYDPADKTTLFQDAAGTVPVTADGDPVGLMLDKSGYAINAMQSDNGARPVYKTDGQKHWIAFNGTSQFMSAPWGALLFGSRAIVAAVASGMCSSLKSSFAPSWPVTPQAWKLAVR